MKEATGEGSMTIITIVIIVALAAAAAIVIGVMMNKAEEQADSVQTPTDLSETIKGEMGDTE